MPHSASQPIGIFDSGIGGLSVLHHIRQQLPHEQLLYVADNAHIPYGEKSPEFIIERSLHITDFFVQQDIKALVVACNTATAAAINQLRNQYSFPIIGMEPAIKPAAAHTDSGIVGVLATEGTLNSKRFENLLKNFDQHVEFIIQPCSGWVEHIENDFDNDLLTKPLVEQYVLPLLEKGADTLVLGCTHYPFLKKQIKSIAGEHINIIDTGEAIARELKRRLSELNIINQQPPASERFWASDNHKKINSLFQQLWNDNEITVDLLRSS